MRVNNQTKKSYELTYAGGYDKSYPSLEAVRLEKLFFKNHKGKILDFGCGPGTNGLHFLKLGYDVTFCDISSNALKKVKKKLKINKIKRTLKSLTLVKKTIFSKQKSDF